MIPARLRRIAFHAIGLTLVGGLAACATGNPSAVGLQRDSRTKLQPGVSTRQDAVTLLGKPDEALDMPRAAVDKGIRDQCMQWDQRSLRALFWFDDYLDRAGGGAWQQETQVYLTADDRVCSWGIWTWPKGSRNQEKFLPKG